MDGAEVGTGLRLLVVGAGSTGGYIGARLAEAGRDVTFLVRPSRAAQLSQTGLRIVSPQGDVTAVPKVVVAGDLADHYDAVLLGVKGFQLDAALSDAAPAVGPETMILSVLNGMRHVDVVAARFGAHHVVGCVLKIATLLEDDGSIVHLNPLQDLSYGELDGTISPRVRSLHGLLQGAGFDARPSESIRREMWEKWALLASAGAITCLMRGTVGEVESSPGGTAFALGLFDEVIAIINAVGTPPSDRFISAARTQLTAPGSPFASSMYRDLQRNRAVEVEDIIGDLVRRGSAAGLSTPLLGAAYSNLALYQSHHTTSPQERTRS